MQISRDVQKAMLLLTSISILGLGYNVLGFESAGIDILLLTISGITIKKPEIFWLTVLAALTILTALELKHTIQELKSHYAAGYKNPSFIGFVTNHIAAICGHSAHGAPLGNFKPGLLKKPVKPGNFRGQNIRTSEEIFIEIPGSIHFKSVLNGLWCAATSKSMLLGAALMALGAWSAVIAFRFLVNAI